MCGQTSQRHRFLMGLPPELVVQHSLQRFSRVRHFVIEFGQNSFAYRHDEGAHIVRVHEVKTAAEAARVAEAIRQVGYLGH